ncbi:Intraflagellar transport protein 46 [Quaeritorhiza haematococci]|nr:Intraflagellar transport protein 46 [Quaeritorhiza haematococci]
MTRLKDEFNPNNSGGSSEGGGDVVVRKPRPTGSARRREQKLTADGKGSSAASLLLGSNEFDQYQRRARMQVEDDEALARVIALEEDEKIAKKMQKDYEDGFQSRPGTSLRNMPAKSETALNLSSSKTQIYRNSKESGLEEASKSHSNLAALVNDEQSLNRTGGFNDLRPGDVDPRAKELRESQQQLARAGSMTQNPTQMQMQMPTPMQVQKNPNESSSQASPSNLRASSTVDHSATSSPSHGVDGSLASDEELDDDDEEEEEDDDPASNSNASLQLQIQELFTYISTFQPETVELVSELKCFIPEYIPAIGDIDPMIKIPPPSMLSAKEGESAVQETPMLGLTMLDEPSAKQSDSAVLDLQLRAASKASTTTTTQQVRSIQLSFSQTPSAAAGQKALAQWVQNVNDLHLHKPPDRVEYSKRMPDIDNLMAEWPGDADDLVSKLQLPSADIDLPLQEYVRLLCIILDIPVYHNRGSSGGPGGVQPQIKGVKAQSSRGAGDKASDPLSSSQTSAKKSHAHVEALHVLFTLFSEFKNSQHFGKVMPYQTFGGAGGFELHGNPAATPDDFLKLW